VSSGHLRQRFVFPPERVFTSTCRRCGIKQGRTISLLCRLYFCATCQCQDGKHVRGIGAESSGIFFSGTTWPGQTFANWSNNTGARGELWCEKEFDYARVPPGEIWKERERRHRGDSFGNQVSRRTTVGCDGGVPYPCKTLGATGNNKTRAAEPARISLKNFIISLKELRRRARRETEVRTQNAAAAADKNSHGDARPGCCSSRRFCPGVLRPAARDN